MMGGMIVACLWDTQDVTLYVVAEILRLPHLLGRTAYSDVYQLVVLVLHR